VIRSLPCRKFVLLVGIVAVACRTSSAAPPITAAVLTPDGLQVVLGSQQGMEVRSWPDLKPMKMLATELEHVHDLSFAPDGKWLLVAGGSPAEAGSVELRSWPDGRLIQHIKEHADLVYRVAWSPDGTRWATASADGICNVMAADTGQRKVRYKGHSRPVLTIAWLPDGQTIVSAGVDQTIRVWNGTTGEHVRTLDNHVGSVNDVAVRPANTRDVPATVASVSEDRTVRLWQPSVGRLLRFARLKSPPRTLVWSPDGNRLVIACNDGHVCIVDADTAGIISDAPADSGRIHALLIDQRQSRILYAGDSEPSSARWSQD
jgi:WD40 repeat protein